MRTAIHQPLGRSAQIPGASAGTLLALSMAVALLLAPSLWAAPSPRSDTRPPSRNEGVTIGLYRDGQLIESIQDTSFADLRQGSSRKLSLHGDANTSGASEFGTAVSPATTERNAALIQGAEAGQRLQHHVRGIVQLFGADRLSGNDELQRLGDDFRAGQSQIRDALTKLQTDLEQRGLPPTILERHAEILRQHDEHVAEVDQALAATLAGTPGAGGRLHALLEQATFLRQPTLPKEPTLQTRAVEAPRLTRAEADALLPVSGSASRNRRSSGRSLATLRQMPADGGGDLTLHSGLPSAADLQPTPDVEITQAIIDKAAELGNSPLALYEFVRNNVGFQPYLGSRKASDFTLQQLHGNDTDQASLLIALLRGAGIPARYARGTIELTPDQAMAMTGVEDPNVAASILTTAGLDGVAIVNGTEVVAVRCTRVWVQVYVPFSNYRGGVSGDDSGKAWIPLDPSFKAWSVTEGQDVLGPMGWNADSFLANYVSAFNAASPIEQFQADIQSWLDVNRPGITIPEIERRLAITPQSLGLLPASLPYQVVAVTTEMSELEDAKRYKVRFHLRNGATTLINHTLRLPELLGHRLTIEYVGATPADQATIDSYGSIYETPPSAVSVRPLLKLDEVVIATGASGIGMGRPHSSDMHFLQPAGDDNVQPLVANEMTAGNGQAIAFDSFLDVHDFLFESGGVTRTNYFEELMYETAVQYLRLVDDGQEAVERTMRVVSLQDVSEAIVENSVKVTYSGGGIPLTFEWTGLIVDADRRIIGPFPVDGNNSKKVPYMKLTGYDGSFMEHRVFEDNFESPAVSTIRAFHVSAQQGINLCTITTSIAGQCPGFSHNASVTAAVNAALAKGNIVIIPRTSIQYEQWAGTGYIDMEPATGAAGYIISGGINGNVSVSGGAIVDWLWPIFPPCLAWPWNIDVRIIQPPMDSPDTNAIFTACDTSRIEFKFEVKANCLFGPTTVVTNTRRSSISKKAIADIYGGGDYVLRMSSLFSAPVVRRFTILKPEPMELAPELKDENGNAVIGSTKPRLGEFDFNPMTEVNPNTDRIAHREIKIRFRDGKALAGRKLKWKLMAVRSIRGDWDNSPSHSDYFEASQEFLTSGFSRISAISAETEIIAEGQHGISAVRINVPPIAFNLVNVVVEVAGFSCDFNLLRFEVPAIVVIDPGHGGTSNNGGSSWNNATSSSGILEKTMTLEFGDALANKLRQLRSVLDLNLWIHSTRSTDAENPSLATRARKARDSGADILLSLHFNGFNAVARGTETWIHSSSNVNAAEDEELALRVNSAVFTALAAYDGNAKNRGVQSKVLGVLNDSSLGNTASYHPVRAALLETEFIDVPDVDALLNTGSERDSVRADIMSGIAWAIIEDLYYNP
jgi:N-acetylmuramoyl-L-alanine amidase/transglutaminase-like putative cysteine protease